MRIILAVIAGLLAFTTFIYEDPDLLPTKLGARLFTYGQIVITWHLWACGSSWKYISIHILGIFASLNLNTIEPHPAAYGLLMHACLACLWYATRRNTLAPCHNYSEAVLHPKCLFLISTLPIYHSLPHIYLIWSSLLRVIAHQKRTTGRPSFLSQTLISS